MSDSNAFGYMRPGHASSEFERTMFRAQRLIAKIRTMMPVRIVKVYKQDGKTVATRGEVAGAGFVDVQPIISQVDGRGQKTDHGTIYHIPYTRSYGGDFAIIADPVKGDVGYITVGDRDSSSFNDTIRQGDTRNVTPGSSRRYDVANSVYIGGVLNKAPSQYITATDQGITIADKNGNKITMDSSGVTITANNIKLIGTVFLGGDTNVATHHVSIDTAPTSTVVFAKP